MFDIYIPSTNLNNPTLYLRGQIPTLLSSDFPRNTWNNVKIEFRTLNTKIYVNNNYLYELNPTATNAIFQFRCINSEISFKNVIIYEIP